jgi:hypothetical protein
MIARRSPIADHARMKSPQEAPPSTVSDDIAIVFVVAAKLGGAASRISRERTH